MISLCFEGVILIMVVGHALLVSMCGPDCLYRLDVPQLHEVSGKIPPLLDTGLLKRGVLIPLCLLVELCCLEYLGIEHVGLSRPRLYDVTSEHLLGCHPIPTSALEAT